MKEDSMVMEILSDYKKSYKRMFIIWIITFISFLGLLGYTIYLLNDTAIVEQSSQEISDVDTIENSNITNGDFYGQDKTN